MLQLLLRPAGAHLRENQTRLGVFEVGMVSGQSREEARTRTCELWHMAIGWLKAKQPIGG